jgi:hypothetical protein
MIKKNLLVRTRVLLAVTLALSAAALLFHLRKPALPPLIIAVRQIAGHDAMNCGTVDLTDYGAFKGSGSTNPIPIDTCAVSAFSSRRPFYARYYWRSDDTSLSKVVVGSSSGKVYILSQYLNSVQSPMEAPVKRSVCSNPTVVKKDGAARIECLAN